MNAMFNFYWCFTKAHFNIKYLLQALANYSEIIVNVFNSYGVL